MCINMYQAHTIYVIPSRLLISHRTLRKNQYEYDPFGNTLITLLRQITGNTQGITDCKTYISSSFCNF